MLKQLQTKLEARLRQREQAIANVNALNGAIDQLKELMDECVKHKSSEPVKEEDTPG